MRSAIVAGCNGSFGRIFAEKLATAGVVVHGVDLQPMPRPGLQLASYTSASIATRDSGLTLLLATVDWVLLCVPSDSVLEALPTLLDNLAPTCAVIDISSVKSPIAEQVRRKRSAVGYLSIHPMFPPVSDFEGRAIVVTPLSANAGTSQFVQLLSCWKPVLTEMSPAEHDISTSLVQALPHAVLISFGLALADASVNFQKLWRISTPIQKTLLAALFRVAANDKLTHFDLQHQNPFASNARASLVKAVQRLDDAAVVAAPDGFLELLGQIEAMLENARSELAVAAASIVTAPSLAAGHTSSEDSRELGIE